MIEQIMDWIHNYFVREKRLGRFTISDGLLNCDFLQDGQYFKVVGSVFNDGVHQYPGDVLTDESFVGEVWALGVPPALVALAAEIEDWVEKYGEAVNSPYQSESFGGYSYSKAAGTGANGAMTPGASWQTVFGTRLNHWRKIA